MELKDIFTMVKVDRYTADGCEELNKAREADVEDRTYQIGEISQKTGLQKTANGWVKPKANGAGKHVTGNAEQKKNKHFMANAQNHFDAASKVAATEADKANLKSIKSFMDEEHATFKNALYNKAESLVRKGANGNPDPENEKSLLKLAEAAGMGDDLKLYLKEEVNSKYEFGGNKTESHPAAGATNGDKWQKNTDYLGRERISMETPQGGKVSIYESENPKQKNARFRVDTGDHYNLFNTMEEAKAFAEKHFGAEDSAPRVLTGDYKVRIRKA